MHAPSFSLLFCSVLCYYEMKSGRRGPHSLDHRPPAVLQAELQLLQDLAALLQFGGGSVRERHVVNGEAPLLVGVQQRRDTVLVQFASGAEDKHLLHALVLEFLCPAGIPRHNRRDAKKPINGMKSVAKNTAGAISLQWKQKAGLQLNLRKRKFKKTKRWHGCLFFFEIFFCKYLVCGPQLCLIKTILQICAWNRYSWKMFLCY